MTRATQRIADGDFAITLTRGSRDELGSLADSINCMAARLEGFVSGQKRFLGDIAHELCAPLARMQLALGILETRAPKEEIVADVREEADHMSALVGELLAFSKASLRGHTPDVRGDPLCRGARGPARGRSQSSRGGANRGTLRGAGRRAFARAGACKPCAQCSSPFPRGIEIHAGPGDGGELLLTVADSAPECPRRRSSAFSSRSTGSILRAAEIRAASGSALLLSKHASKPAAVAFPVAIVNRADSW